MAADGSGPDRRFALLAALVLGVLAALIGVFILLTRHYG